MAFGNMKRAVGLFPTRQAAEQALIELRQSGFPMDQVSVISKHADDDNNQLSGAEMTDRLGNKAGDGAREGAKTGGVLGGIAGLLVGLGLLAIPGVGPVLVAGATGTAIATALSGAAIGAATGGLSGALIGLGIPEYEAKLYNDRVSAGQYLVVIEGTELEIDRSGTVLSHRGIENWGVYDTSDVATTMDRTAMDRTTMDRTTMDRTTMDRTTSPTTSFEREIR